MLATLLTIVLLHWLALITPGANLILVTQLAASGRRTSACNAAVGISVAAFVWTLLAILGVQALFAAHAQLRIAVQIAGGIYLCYIAFRLWRSGVPAGGQHATEIAPWAAFRLGFVTNITNPKSALFFGSVFAAALPRDADAALLAAAVALIVVNAVIWHLFLALAFSHPRIQVGYDRRRTLLNRLASGVIGAYGLRLLVATINEGRGR